MSEVFFGPYRLAGENGPLIYGGRDVKLAPKTLAVLWMLVRQPGQVVTRRALLAAIWPTVVVSDDALSFQVQLLRQALKDDTRAPRYIATVHRVGFRFVAEVRQKPKAKVEAEATIPVADRAANPEPVASVVGRAAELQHLLDLLKSPVGRGQVVFLAGEEGIGKSALLDLFLNHAGKLPDSPLIACGQCTEQYGCAREPYLPILDALGRLCRAPDGATHVELLKLRAPSWILQMPSLLADDDYNALRQGLAGLTRERMLREMVEMLEASGRGRRLILVLEDLQWSDSATLDLVGMLARRCSVGGPLLLGSYRPADMIPDNPRLKVLKQELVARRQATEIVLGCLCADDVHSYLRRRLPSSESDLLLISELVFRRTQGNPLFMAQMADYLEQRGVAQVLGGDHTALPESLRELIDAQIGRLSAVEQRLLEEASVAGNTFTCAGIAATADRSTDSVEERCRVLAQRGRFIEELDTARWPDGTASTRYRFRHVLYQEVLYRRSTLWQRTRWHLDLAARLEVAYGERTAEIAEELALHLERGAEFPRARRYLRVANDSAL